MQKAIRNYGMIVWYHRIQSFIHNLFEIYRYGKGGGGGTAGMEWFSSDVTHSSACQLSKAKVQILLFRHDVNIPIGSEHSYSN